MDPIGKQALFSKILPVFSPLFTIPVKPFSKGEKRGRIRKELIWHRTAHSKH